MKQILEIKLRTKGARKVNSEFNKVAAKVMEASKLARKFGHIGTALLLKNLANEIKRPPKFEPLKELVGVK